MDRSYWNCKRFIAGMIAGWIGCAGLTAAANNVTLVDEGQPSAVIVLPESTHDNEQRAADELAEHIRLISGAELPVVADGEDTGGLTPIRLGGAADAGLDEPVRAVGDNPSSFALIVDGDGISIRGLSPEGTLFGVYELLEQLGVRWYMPGELGRVLPPETGSLAIATQRNLQAPSFDYRRFQHITYDWPQRVRMGGEPRSTGAHGIPPFPGNRSLFEEHPEYYAMLGGQRRLRQICASNPGAVARTVEHIRQRHDPTDARIYLGMGPNDGGGYCECEDCRALDGDVYDPFYGENSVTGRYIWFFNQVLEALEEDFPNLHLVWYVYARHMMPPPPELTPNPRIVGVFAPITLDRIRGMDNPMSPDRHVLRWLIDAWADSGAQTFYYRGYYNNLACTQFPKTQIDRVRNEIPALHAKGVNVMRVEVIWQSWATDPISLYLASRMMWDVKTDADAVLDEFYRLFYGPAEAPMRQYHEGLEAAFRDTPYFTGSSYKYLPIFLDHPRRDRLRGYLEEALELSGERGESIYAERVWALRQGYRRMDYFLDMIDARNRHDFATAHAAMEAFDTLTDELVDYALIEPDGRRRGEELAHRLVHWNESRDRGRNSYFSRFFRATTDTGHARAVDIGELVAPLADEWLFLLDPAEIGEIGGWHRPGELGGNWQPIRTSSRSWSDQGLHYYKGIAWYRQKVEIPEGYEDRPVYLWFGGVDRLASVWINGHFMGTSREPREGVPGVPGSFRPFDMPTVREDGSSALNFGGDNWVVVQIENKSLSEIGTGGILAPVMFWAPTDPEWNPRD